MTTCSHCGRPITSQHLGLRYFGTHTAHRQSDCLAILLAEIERLAAERDALAKDAARLEWLVAQFRVMSLDMGGNHVWVPKWTSALRGPTVIDAIDAAMEAKHD